MAYPALVWLQCRLGEGIETHLFFTFWGFDMIAESRMHDLQFSPVGNTAMHLPGRNTKMPQSLSPMPGMTQMATKMMKKQIADLGIFRRFPTSSTRSWLPAVTGPAACPRTWNKLEETDLRDDVEGIINATDFMEISEGGQMLFILRHWTGAAGGPWRRFRFCAEQPLELRTPVGQAHCSRWTSTAADRSHRGTDLQRPYLTLTPAHPSPDPPQPLELRAHPLDKRTAVGHPWPADLSLYTDLQRARTNPRSAPAPKPRRPATAVGVTHRWTSAQPLDLHGPADLTEVPISNARTHSHACAPNRCVATDGSPGIAFGRGDPRW